MATVMTRVPEALDFFYNASMDAALNDRRSVDSAVASLQDRLADGDPSDLALRKHCQTVLASLRAAYRADPALFTKETIETLREMRELLDAD
jgi:hypothetical protein